MLENIAFVDFETRSTCDLKVKGAVNYAKDNTTDIVCLAYALNDKPPVLWLPWDDLPIDLCKHISDGKPVVAHNYLFDLSIWNHVLAPKYSFPNLNPKQMQCSMAMAYNMGFPGSLERAAAAAGIDAKKDMKAHRIMLQLCRPKKTHEDGTVEWHEDAEKYQIVYKYCLNDINVTRDLFKCLTPITGLERKVFELDYKINFNGVLVDTDAVRHALDLVEHEKTRLDSKIRSLSNGKISSPSEVSRIKKFIENEGIDVSGIAKNDIVELLNTELPPKVSGILRLRQEFGKSSNAKLETMLGLANEDGRLRGMFQYVAAGTGRWGGRGVQLHNMPRPMALDQDQIDEILTRLHTNTISAEEIDLSHGSPLTAISDSLRGFLVPEYGKLFYICDFASIEARVLAWLAGEEKILEVFRTHGKIYEAAAIDIFGGEINTVTAYHRLIGKVTVLALGYQGGKGAFQMMAKTYNVKVTDEMADQIKLRWRAKNRRIVTYWYDLERAAIAAIKNPGKKFAAGHKGREVLFLKKGSFLMCRLPSGRISYYPFPKVEHLTHKNGVAVEKWQSEKESITFMAIGTPSGKWERVSTYGGSLAENCVSGVARDILAEAMLRLDNKGYKIVIHVHDEIVCEELPFRKIEEMEAIMCENPTWAKDLPIEAKGLISARYRK